MKKLAINGGKPVQTEPFPNQAGIGDEEKKAVLRVMDSQLLSHYRGNGKHYKGGKEIQALEHMWSATFGNEHSIACNSATSGLHIACAAIGIKPGDEVIVSPYSMSCSATAPMVFGATPVFADVEEDTGCIDIEDIRRKITPRS